LHQYGKANNQATEILYSALWTCTQSVIANSDIAAV
jgi:hypothetical protein